MSRLDLMLILLDTVITVNGSPLLHADDLRFVHNQ